MTRPVNVKITGDSRGAVVAIDRTESGLRSLNSTAAKSSTGLAGLKRGLAGIGGALLAGGALREGVSLIKESVGLASNLAETTSKVSTVFGKSSAGILSWARTTDAAMSMSQRSILDTVTGFDLLLTNKGLGKVSEKWSKDLTGLAADLSSFFNVGADEAAAAITSALKGEADPIEKFGVTLNDATLKARAYAMGLYSGKGPLTATVKAQATYAELMRQTSKAQGDLLRTQGSAANQMRQFGVNVESLKTTLGTAFTPLIEEYLPGINNWLKSINNEKSAEKLGETFLGWAKSLEEAWPKIQKFGRELKDAFAGVDSEQLAGNFDALKGAAENLGGGVRTLFDAFNNLSPEAKANIATIVAAGATIGLLAKSNPVVKIGVDLVSGALGTISESLISRVLRGTMKVSVTNWPRIYPDGDVDGGGNSGKGKGKTPGLGGVGIAGLVALVAPLVLDKLPLSDFFKDRIGGMIQAYAIASATAWVVAALGLSNPIGWVVGITAGVTYLGKKYGDQQSALENLSSYTTGGLRFNYQENKRQDADLVAESKKLRAADEREALRRSKADLTEAEKRYLADKGEAENRRYVDFKLANEVAGVKADQAAARAAFTKMERLMRSDRSVAPTASAQAAGRTPIQNIVINVTGSGSPTTVARELERQLRRVGNPAQVSVVPA